MRCIITPSPALPPRFEVINHRADVVFRLLRNGTTLPMNVRIVVAGESPVVRNAIAARPSQGHLALDDSGRCVFLRQGGCTRL